MRLSKRFLLDVNMLVALTSREHEHHRKANSWFNSLENAEWGVSPLTEAGYMRLTTNPKASLGAVEFAQAIAVLDHLTKRPRYCFWPITESWTAVTAPFADRIFGHQQVTDAYLLGLAIKADGVLVTFDRGLKYMAGAEFSRNLLVLE
jgi:hypothetical protein